MADKGEQQKTGKDKENKWDSNDQTKNKQGGDKAGKDKDIGSRKDSDVSKDAEFKKDSFLGKDLEKKGDQGTSKQDKETDFPKFDSDIHKQDQDSDVHKQGKGKNVGRDSQKQHKDRDSDVKNQDKDSREINDFWNIEYRRGRESDRDFDRGFQGSRGLMAPLMDPYRSMGFYPGVNYIYYGYTKSQEYRPEMDRGYHPRKDMGRERF